MTPIEKPQFGSCKRRSRVMARPAFTLIEMLVVISVVTILLTITIVVGVGVIGQSKVRQCKSLLQTLDSLLTEYDAELQSMPAYDRDDYFEPEGGQAGDVRPESAVFISQVRGYVGADRILSAMPTEFLVERSEYYDGVTIRGEASLLGSIRETDLRLTVVDPWGTEIVYVHPRNKRAALGDGQSSFDGYGNPANERPYFLSAGPDQKFYNPDEGVPTNDIARKDNVFSYESVNRPEDQ